MDPLIEQFRREQRLNTILVVAAVIGILATAGCSTAFALGAFSWSAAPNAGAIAFCGVPFVVAMALGYVTRAIAMWFMVPVEPLPRAIARPRA